MFHRVIFGFALHVGYIPFQQFELLFRSSVCVCVGVCGVLRVSKLCERVVCERVVCQEVVCERVVCEQVVYDGRPTEEGGDGTGGCKEKQDPHTKMWGIGSWLYFPCSNMCQIIQLKQIATNVH